MKKLPIILLASLFLLGGTPSASAVTIDLFEWIFNIDGTVTGKDFYDTTGMPVSGTLDSNDLGTLTWTTTVPGAHSFSVYLDYELDEFTNTWFNEYGEASGAPDSGLSWQIDDPIFNFITSQVENGDPLDNFNYAPFPPLDDNGDGLIDFYDVAIAFAWDFNLEPLDVATISLTISDSMPSSDFFLRQADPQTGYVINNGELIPGPNYSEFDIYFSTDLNITPIPEPGTILLLSTGIAGLMASRMRRKK